MRNLIILFVLLPIMASGQRNNKMDAFLKKYNTGEIPYIYPNQLKDKKFILLDSREKREYEISHLRRGTYIGHDFFDINNLPNNITKSDTIVVYCSLGVRSETIALKLKNKGFTNIYNLYGGLFYWKNLGFDIYDNTNNVTEKIHGFDKYWGKWLKKGIVVYE